MAITAYTGPPGAGKSHALVKEVILPALLNGRRVVSNIDGLDPDAIRAYCLERVEDANRIGQLVVFDGSAAQGPGFFPDEETKDEQTTVKAGDLVVFDEWALYFPRRGQWPKGCNVEPFMRWHRHLTAADGSATDLCIGTQLATDIHMNVRGLVSKSYKFRKLDALGAQGSYTWYLYEGHLQPKDGHYRQGTGSYDKAVFPLYASSAAAKTGNHTELKTNRKTSIWTDWKTWGMLGGGPALLIAAGLFGWSMMPGDASAAETASGSPHTPAQGRNPPVAPAAPPASPWRVVGSVEGVAGSIVMLEGPDATRIIDGRDCKRELERVISCTIDGATAYAESRAAPSVGGRSLLDGMQSR